MPPTAAATGMIVWLGVDRPPTSSSRLISRPTTKKKMAIRPSLIHRMAALERTQPLTPTVILVCHRLWYSSAQGELAHTKATIVQIIRATPPAASILKKASKDFSR